MPPGPTGLRRSFRRGGTGGDPPDAPRARASWSTTGPSAPAGSGSRPSRASSAASAGSPTTAPRPAAGVPAPRTAPFLSTSGFWGWTEFGNDPPYRRGKQLKLGLARAGAPPDQRNAAKAVVGAKR